jgi:tRNA-specific 2-thiouridylase
VLAEGVSLPTRARVRVRYRHAGDDGVVMADGERGERAAHVLFDRPVRAVTRGQVAVLYDGERVLGGGRIAGPARPKGADPHTH